MIVAGIDPGLSGGITFLDTEILSIVESLPMPTFKLGKKEVLRPSQITFLLTKFHPAHVCIEHVGAMPGQGVTSMFSFGYGAGILEGIVAALQIPYTLVRPQKWMKEVLSGLPKDAGTKSSVVWCQRVFPGRDWRASERSRKPHDGMTDSAALAWYARTMVSSKTFNASVLISGNS